MKVEEMALRSEIRQMLNEAGFNKETLKNLVKDVLHEEVRKAINQGIHESDFDGMVQRTVESICRDTAKEHLKRVISDRIVGDWFNKMKVDVNIETENGELLPRRGE